MTPLSTDAANESSRLAVAAAHAWTRSGVTVRLTDHRRALLQALVKECSPPLSPTAAIDHAIELATQATKRGEENEQWDDLNAQLQKLAAQAERRVAEIIAEQAEMERRARELFDAFAAVLARSAGDADHSDDGPMSMRTWVEREARALPKQTFLAKARWQSTARIDETHVTVELMVERVAAPHLKGAAAHGIPALVRSSPIGKESPLASCNAMASFYAMFTRPLGGEWTMSLHAIQAGGRPGPSMWDALL